LAEKRDSKQVLSGFFMIFILDTSAVTDPRLRELTSSRDTEGVLQNLSKIMSVLRTEAGVLFYTTPLVLNEMRRYLLANNVSEKSLNELVSWLIIKSPDKFVIRIPAAIISEYIEDLRRRVYKGLRIAEELLKSVAIGKKNAPEAIRELREKYRDALRKGIVDSPEDLDAILLAYELKGVLVTNDDGMRKMAVSLGIITMDPLYFLESLKRMLRALKHDRIIARE
jgi:RNA ligase partner protein